MTRPADGGDIARQTAERIWGDVLAGRGPKPAWDEGLEARIAAVACSYDDETGRAARLLPRKDRP